MNPGRNDPCPCGSGKKYKKCCLLKKRDADSFILGLNNLYALVKTINTQLITKSNKSDYSMVSLTHQPFSKICKTKESFHKAFSLLPAYQNLPPHL